MVGWVGIQSWSGSETGRAISAHKVKCFDKLKVNEDDVNLSYIVTILHIIMTSDDSIYI